MTIKHDALTIRNTLRCENYLQRDRKGKAYICPYCGSGTKDHGTGGITKIYDDNTVTCYSCNKKADAIDLYAKARGFNPSSNPKQYVIDGKFNEVIKAIEAEGLIDRPSRLNNKPVSDFKPTSKETPGDSENATQSHTAAENDGQPDFTDYYTKCAERLSDPEAVKYLKSRGISRETAAAYHIGFDPAADPAHSGHPLPRLIVPVNPSFFVGRAIDTATDYRIINSGKGSEPTDSRKLYKPGTVFITEGIFDALSISEAARELHRDDISAISLNSTQNADKLISRIKADPQEVIANIVLSLDNDDAGHAAAKKLQSELEALGIKPSEADLTAAAKNSGKTAKDPNEALTADRAAFIGEVGAAASRAEADPDSITQYIDSSLLTDIEEYKKSGTLTGFDELDGKTRGLFPGLYVIAAIPSLGKTTFCWQLADQLAARGKPVVYFSLEQSKLELITKSFSRMLKQKDDKSTMTSADIRRGELSADKLQPLMMEYKATTGDRINIVEGGATTDIKAITDYCKNYIMRKNRKPVVIIDYLQIVRPSKEMQKATAKEITESNLITLRQFGRDYNIPVIAISSLNRSGYYTPIDSESLKETGGIEYGADAIFGLQYSCMSAKTEENENEKEYLKRRSKVSEAKADEPRKIDLVILKCRNAKQSDKIELIYWSDTDYYIEKKTEKTTKRRYGEITGTL